jgi:hypothetical protein
MTMPRYGLLLLASLIAAGPLRAVAEEHLFAPYLGSYELTLASCESEGPFDPGQDPCREDGYYPLRLEIRRESPTRYLLCVSEYESGNLFDCANLWNHPTVRVGALRESEPTWNDEWVGAYWRQTLSSGLGSWSFFEYFVYQSCRKSDGECHGNLQFRMRSQSHSPQLPEDRRSWKYFEAIPAR